MQKLIGGAPTATVGGPVLFGRATLLPAVTPLSHKAPLWKITCLYPQFQRRRQKNQHHQIFLRGYATSSVKIPVGDTAPYFEPKFSFSFRFADRSSRLRLVLGYLPF